MADMFPQPTRVRVTRLEATNDGIPKRAYEGFAYTMPAIGRPFLMEVTDGVDHVNDFTTSTVKLVATTNEKTTFQTNSGSTYELVVLN